MTDLASPVVQVVTVGRDWPAIAAAISGGVVGLAGILFASRQSNKAIRAEDARAKLAEKRRIYANCIGALTAYGLAASAAARASALPPAQRAELVEKTNSTRQAAENSVSEVYLIGPIEVARLSNRAIRALLQREIGNQPGDDPAHVVAELTMAMRRDLGEHVAPIEQMADVSVIP